MAYVEMHALVDASKAGLMSRLDAIDLTVTHGRSR